MTVTRQKHEQAQSLTDTRRTPAQARVLLVGQDGKKVEIKSIMGEYSGDAGGAREYLWDLGNQTIKAVISIKIGGDVQD